MVHGSSSPSSRRQPNAENPAAALGLLHEVLRPASVRSLRMRARNAHWSAHGTKRSSRNTLWPRSRGPFCRGKAMRLPNPPCGNVS